MMKLEHIVSTMNRDEFTFLNDLHMKAPCLVVNQNRDAKNETVELSNGLSAQVLSTPEKGLSRSRNMLLRNATGDICIMGDDDVEYLDGYEKIISQAYETHPDADIIVFRFTHEKGKETRARYNRDLRMRLWNISKAASVEITFRRERVLQAGPCFDERLGLGAEFPSGEENAFLADALRAGLKIYHVPQTICFAVEAHTVQNDDEVADYLHIKGAAFGRIYKTWFFIFALLFVFLKRKGILGGISLWKGYQYMKNGRKAYLN